MEANNMAAMREALRTLRQRFDNNVKVYQDRYFKFSGWHWHKKAAEAARWRDVFYELWEACDAALSAPPRNCDVGTAEEQSARYDAQCDAYHKTTGKCDDCPIYKEECKMTGNIPHCQLVWAQMPYESEVEK